MTEQQDFVENHGWKLINGFRIDKDELPEGNNLIYFEELDTYVTKLEYWIHTNTNYVFEDIDDLEEHILENCECDQCNTIRMEREHENN